nr:hypothetical protein [Mycobacterium sp. E3298]
MKKTTIKKEFASKEANEDLQISSNPLTEWANQDNAFSWLNDVNFPNEIEVDEDRETITLVRVDDKEVRLELNGEILKSLKDIISKYEGVWNSLKTENKSIFK